MQTEIRLWRGRPFHIVAYAGKVERPFAALLSQCQRGTHLSTWSPCPSTYVVSLSQGLFFVTVMKCMYRIPESSGNV
jgi:hypothetical protein